VKFLLRLCTALNLLPSIATLLAETNPNSRQSTTSCVQSAAEQYRRGGVDDVKDARTGSAGARKAYIPDRIDLLAKLAAKR
jgi:hypothetical protein